MSPVGFLHTSDVHVPVFNALVDELAPGTQSVTVVDTELLSEARRLTPDHPSVSEAIENALAELVASGAERIVCTCSTVGGAAEIVGRKLGVSVDRVDRAMAEQAVDGGRRVLVLAALDSTIGPTTELLDSVAAGSASHPEITTRLVDGAWHRFEADDLDGYYALVADAIERAGDEVDVVVLAQASMAPAAELVVPGGPKVLSSPRPAVERLVHPSATP